MRRDWVEYTCDLVGCDVSSTDEEQIKGWISVGHVYFGIANAPRSFCCVDHAIAYLSPSGRSKPEPEGPQPGDSDVSFGVQA